MFTATAPRPPDSLFGAADLPVQAHQVGRFNDLTGVGLFIQMASSLHQVGVQAAQIHRRDRPQRPCRSDRAGQATR
jgi:hypothetical protein